MDLVFIVLVFLALAALGTAVAAAFRGQRADAVRILIRLVICTEIYLAVASVVSLATPRKVFQAGQPQCNGEWCLAVAGTERQADYRIVTLRLFTTAQRVSMGENGVRVYLLDSTGRRYSPIADPGDVPLNVRVAPGESVMTTRRFPVPATVPELTLVVDFTAGPGLVIGEVHWFRPPDIMLLP